MTAGNSSNFSISISDFMKLDDEDLKKYIYLNECISDNGATIDVTRRETDSIIGYFSNTKHVNINNQGKFYCTSKCHQYLVYDKLTKKVRISRTYAAVFPKMLEDYFDSPEILSKFIPRPTATLCKKIIEGKIYTVRDVIKYTKSYTIRNKNIPDEVIYTFLSIPGALHNLHNINNPENIKSYEELRVLNTMIPSNICFAKIFRFNVEDANKLNKMYEEWTREQSKKLDRIQGQGNDKNGDTIIKKSTFEVPDNPF